MSDPAVAVVVTQDPSGEAAALLAAALRQGLADQNFLRLALPGGSALAAARPAQTRLGGEWARVALTWTDERCVPKADPDSNWGEAARRGLLGGGPEKDSPAPRTYLPLYLEEETPREAAARALRVWESDFHGAIDIALLGLGEDGHIASLFPPAPSPGAPARSFDSAGCEAVFHVEHSPKPPADRISLSLAALATAKQSFLVVQGESKRTAAARVVSGDVALPATHLPNLTLITDLVLEKQHV